MGTRLVRWSIFTVLVALLPFVFSVVRGVQYGEPPDLGDIAGGGELYLLAGAICAAAVGEVIGSGTLRLRVPKLIAGGVAVLFLGLCSLLFADTAASGRAAGSRQIRAAPVATVEREVVAEVSMWIFGLAVTASGCCVGLAEL